MDYHPVSLDDNPAREIELKNVGLVAHTLLIEAGALSHRNIDTESLAFINIEGGGILVATLKSSLISNACQILKGLMQYRRWHYDDS